MLERVRVAIVVGAVALGACRSPAADARRRELAAQGQRLEEALDRLEERLLTDQARVRFWQELRARHESVSAVACTNLGRHADGIANFEEKQREKRAALQKKHRVAAAFVPGAGSVR